MWDASTFPKEYALRNIEYHARFLLKYKWSLITAYNCIDILCDRVGHPAAAAQFSECIMSGLTASKAPHFVVRPVLMYFSREVCLSCVIISDACIGCLLHKGLACMSTMMFFCKTACLGTHGAQFHAQHSSQAAIVCACVYPYMFILCSSRSSYRLLTALTSHRTQRLHLLYASCVLCDCRHTIFDICLDVKCACA